DGHEVVMCHVSRGDRGSFVHTSEEISRIRSEEAGRAAEICGAEATTLGQSDGDVNAADPEQRRLMIDLVRETQPELIITHHPGDYMGDHNETSKLVFDCSFHATLPLLETTKPNYRNVTPIYYMDTLMGLGFQPTEYVDVSAVIDTKTAMLEAHQSQLTWLRDHDDGQSFVAILPVGPMPQYELAAHAINEERLSLAHVHTFNMDEYANEDGVTAPLSWPGSFQRAMLERFFGLIDAELRPPEEQ